MVDTFAAIIAWALMVGFGAFLVYVLMYSLLVLYLTALNAVVYIVHRIWREFHARRR